jgi:hypothetical protein
MPEQLSFCGLICQTCPIFLATRQQNKEQQLRMRMEIVQLCREQYGIQYELEDITDCDGCRTEGGRLFPTCRTCVIRKCARRKGLESCGHCSDYACTDLRAFLETDPEAKERLDDIRGYIRARQSRDRFIDQQEARTTILSAQ